MLAWMRAIAMVTMLGVLETGCFVQGAGGVRLHGASVRGADLGASVGGDALRIVGEGAVYAAGDKDRVTAEMDAALAISPIGWLRGEQEEAPWVDVGGLLGYGGGVNYDGDFASGLFGGWVDVRLGRNSRAYPALHATVVREIYTANAPDVTVFVLGFAWTVRDPNFSFRIDG
jgi:hypothetical protein